MISKDLGPKPNYRRSLRLLISSILLSILIGILSLGCSSGAVATGPVTYTPAPSTTASSTAAATTATSGSDYSIAVYSADKQVATLKISDLLKLNQVKVTTEGGDEQGPTLLSVFASLGIQSFNSVTAFGMTKGRIATTELTLTRDKIDDTVILGMNNRGTAKLTGKNISANSAVIDVNRLVAR